MTYVCMFFTSNHPFFPSCTCVRFEQVQPKKAKKTEGEMSEIMRDVLRGAMRPLSPEAVLVLGFPGMLIKTRNTEV